jgi:hypothetical protein
MSRFKLTARLAVLAAAAGALLGGGLAAALATSPAGALINALAASPSSANFYSQGTYVGLCLPMAGTNGVIYAEVHTSFGTYGDENLAALGNCAAGHEQLVIAADPALFPFVQPGSSSSAPSSADTVSVANPGAQDAVVGVAFGPLDIGATSSLGYKISQWSETGLPAGMTFTTVTTGSGLLDAEIEGTPTGPTGTYLVTVTAADTGLVTGAASFDVTVTS